MNYEKVKLTFASQLVSSQARRTAELIPASFTDGLGAMLLVCPVVHVPTVFRLQDFGAVLTLPSAWRSLLRAHETLEQRFFRRRKFLEELLRLLLVPWPVHLVRMVLQSEFFEVDLNVPLGSTTLHQ